MQASRALPSASVPAKCSSSEREMESRRKQQAQRVCKSNDNRQQPQPGLWGRPPPTGPGFSGDLLASASQWQPWQARAAVPEHP
jgi:hypothetical protein